MLLRALVLSTTLLGDSVVAENVYHGRSRQLHVAIPRREASVEMDGALTEPVWREAALLTGFSQFHPVDGRAATDSTDVFVWYSPTAIHFGVRAFAPRGSVLAKLSDRDRIGADDFVEIILSTFNDGRQALVFGVNALGVQADGTINEVAQSGATRNTDLSANFVYDSKGRLTDSGFEVEVRIPFKSLRYPSTNVQDWGINIVRRVQRLGGEDTWTPVARASASFLSQSGTLKGLTDLRRGLVVDLNPSVVGKQNGLPRNSSSGWTYTPEGPDVGMNVKWGISTNLTLNGTVNPDFSQVEADVGAIQYDPRQAVSFPERRPFFLEGIENFATPNNLIYSRRVAKPDGAVKLTGKAGATNLAMLSAVDDRSTSSSLEDHPIYNMLRVVRDVGGQSRVGLVYTDRVEGDDVNRVLGADARFVFGRIYQVRLQGAGSWTRRDDVSSRGPLWNATFDRSGRFFATNYRINGIADDFISQSGFISRRGIVNAAGDHRFTWYGGKSALMQRYTFGVRGDLTYLYDEFMSMNASQDRKLHLNHNLELRGGWSIGHSVFIETFGYDPALYRGYYVLVPNGSQMDTLPFTGGNQRFANYDYTINVGTPEYSRFSGDFSYVGGIDENFFEWSRAWIHIGSATVNWRPTDRLRVEGRYQHQQYVRNSDRTTVALRRVPRLKMEYQATRSIFVRFVGQYDSDEVDDLRDDARTDGRLHRLINGQLLRLDAEQRNNFRVDWLFSYQPTPGTVFFVGYGSTLTEDASLRFDDLKRRDDGLFVKLSYLFRL